MINAQMKNRNAAPVWAVLGAPLLGIPLLVALLALAAPKPSAPESQTVVTVEQVETIAAEPANACRSNTASLPMRKG